MGRPPITDDQREVAITMLANAIRKDAHLRNRAQQAKETGNVLASATTGRRVEPSRRYVEGMRDMLRVLFAEGPNLVDELLEEAYSMAMGAPTTFTENGQHYQ